jgi:hypothetical protein
MHSFKARTAQADVHLDQATAALRSQLRRMIAAEGTDRTPDWSTLRIWGPFEVFSQRGEIRYEYRGLVDTSRTAVPSRALAG